MVISAASRIVVALAAGVTTIVLARVLGPHDWGSYSIAVSLLAILVAVSTLGVEQGFAYFVGARMWRPRAAFGSALRMAAVTGTLGAVAGLAARVVVPSAFAGLPVSLTAVTVVAVPFSLALAYTAAIALASDRYEASMSMPVVQACLLLALSIPAAILFGRSGAVTALTLAALLSAGGAVVWGRRRLSHSETAEPGQLRRAVSFGLRAYGANTLQLINYRLDIFILAAVASAAAVGQYALAVSATTLLMLLPRALSAVLYPRVARLSASGDETTREMVETKSLRHVTLAVGITTVVMAAALELLVVPLFGADYRPTIDLGLILLPGAAAIGIATVLAATVVGRGKPNYSLLGALIVTPLTIAMYVTMIPWLHAKGAALASTLSYIASFLLFCGFYRRVTGRTVLLLLVPTRSELADLRAFVPSVGRIVRRCPPQLATYDPKIYWDSRARDLIETYDRPESWERRGWMRAGIEESTVPGLLTRAGCETVLVPGAGSGRQYSFLLDAGFSPCGFDISEQLVKECKARFPEVSTWVGDVTEAQKHSEPVDAVVTSAVLQHVTPEHIAEAVESLKALASKLIIVREMTSLSTRSPYQFAHDYSQLFGDWLELFREVTDAREAVTVELFAWSPPS